MMKSFKTLIYQGLYAIYLFSALQIIRAEIMSREKKEIFSKMQYIFQCC